MKFRLLLALVACVLITPHSFAQYVIKGDAAKGQEIVSKVCSACHGPDGNSPLSANPSLAAQHPEYTYKQLNNFQSKNGKPPERSNAIMAGQAAGLSDEDMKNVATYFAAQKRRPLTAHDPELVKRGQLIYRAGLAEKGVPACASCHGPNGSGLPSQFPRVGAQHAEYTASQLKAWRSGERKNDMNRMMQSVAANLTEKDIAAVSEYLAGLR